MATSARSVLRYSARHEAAASDSFADHVINGLTDSPKWLSAKYFYDAAGSDLFEEITRLPEYYPTRTELKILGDNARAMSACIPLAAALVEFGTGSTRKARILLNAAPQIAAYVPVDISAEFLTQQAAAVRRDLPRVAVLPSRPISRATSICRRRPAIARASASSPDRPSAISSRRMRRNFSVRPAAFSGPARP